MSDENLIPVSDDLNMGATIRGYIAGQRLFDRYMLEQVLGRGGMGVVWLAQDIKLDQRVALKFLPETLRLDASALDDLKRETRRGLALAHPHIVRIYDFVDDATAAAISMEYIDGPTLSAMRIDQPARVYEVHQLAEWVTQLVDALDYAHRRAKIVHRDLKPANLMTTLGGELKVADFGIARSISDSVSRVSIKGASSGTLVYMSPQQAQGMPPKTSDDVYALGATLYELLTSKPPFFSGNIQHQLDNITPPSMAERRIELEVDGLEIPREWEQVVAKCLAKDAAARPQSVAQVGELLGLRAAPVSFPTTVTAQATDARSKSFVLPALPVSKIPAKSSTHIFVGVGIFLGLILVGSLGYYFGIKVPAERAHDSLVAKQQADDRAAAAERAQADAEKSKVAAAAAMAAAEKKSDEEKAALLQAQQEANARAVAAEQAAKEARAEAVKAAQNVAPSTAIIPQQQVVVIPPEQIAHEKEVCGHVQALIEAKKPGAALYELQLLTATMTKDRADSITAPFQDALGPFQVQRDAAISASQSGDPVPAIAALQAYAQQDSDDPKIPMAIATVRTRMAPEHTALKTEINQLKLLSTTSPLVNTDPDFLALQNKFANELKQLDDLASHLSSLKSSSRSSRGSISRLISERDAAQKKLAGYRALNAGIGGVFGIDATSGSVADKEREIANLNERISEIQNRPEGSQADIDNAQQKYDAFVAAVPW